MKDLKELFIEDLKDMYDAEHQLVDALPNLEEAAASQELKQALREHLEVTKSQAQRLEEVFREAGEEPDRETCEAMEGLVEEAEDLVSECKGEDPQVCDAGIIGCAQKTEHYEIAGYGTLRTWAEHLGLQQSVDLLQQILDEEGEADKKLTQIAESMVNPAAAHEPANESPSVSEMEEEEQPTTSRSRTASRGQSRSRSADRSRSSGSRSRSGKSRSH